MRKIVQQIQFYQIIMNTVDWIFQVTTKVIGRVLRNGFILVCTSQMYHIITFFYYRNRHIIVTEGLFTVIVTENLLLNRMNIG